jgi:ABC-2 type transport system ATP-binding protein
MNTPALHTQRLTRLYGYTRALDGFTLEVPRGRVVALLGPNGAGKTTLLRLLAGLIEPTEGAAEVLGSPSRNPPAEAARRLAVVIEGVEPPGEASLSQMMALQAGACPTFDRPACELLYMQHTLAPSQAYGALSKGQKRLALAGLALSSGAELLLLDEPADGLDPAVRRTLYDLLRDHATRHESTILVATHVIGDIERVADDVAIISRGRLVLHAALEDLREEVREVELPGAADLPDLGDGIAVLGRRREQDTLLAWVRTTAEAAGQLAERLPAKAAVRPVDLETLYLAITNHPAAARTAAKED